jgi:hypothetical protein
MASNRAPSKSLEPARHFMWYSQLKNSGRWSELWHGYIRCGCGGVRPTQGGCAACGQPYRPLAEYWTTVTTEDGEQIVVPAATNMGGERAYEDYVFLDMLGREWQRPLSEEDRHLHMFEGARPSPRAIVALVFWTYFETRLNRLYEEALHGSPHQALVADNWSIGRRLDKMYRKLFGRTYWDELADLGFPDIAQLLRDVQKARNEFTHGHPAAISDALVQRIVANLKREHESWLAAFNLRIRERNAQ